MMSGEHDALGMLLFVGGIAVLVGLLPHVSWSAPGAGDRYAALALLGSAALAYVAWRQRAWKTLLASGGVFALLIWAES